MFKEMIIRIKTVFERSGPDPEKDIQKLNEQTQKLNDETIKTDKIQSQSTAAMDRTAQTMAKLQAAAAGSSSGFVSLAQELEQVGEKANKTEGRLSSIITRLANMGKNVGSVFGAALIGWEAGKRLDEFLSISEKIEKLYASALPEALGKSRQKMVELGNAEFSKVLSEFERLTTATATFNTELDRTVANQAKLREASYIRDKAAIETGFTGDERTQRLQVLESNRTREEATATQENINRKASEVELEFNRKQAMFNAMSERRNVAILTQAEIQRNKEEEARIELNFQGLPNSLRDEKGKSRLMELRSMPQDRIREANVWREGGEMQSNFDKLQQDIDTLRRRREDLLADLELASARRDALGTSSPLLSRNELLETGKQLFSSVAGQTTEIQNRRAALGYSTYTPEMKELDRALSTQRELAAEIAASTTELVSGANTNLQAVAARLKLLENRLKLARNP